jgi:predicted metal-dependent phosphoesterase TrpH
MKRLIDLHIHTSHSDGEYSAAQVIQMAKGAGVFALSITDHDTIQGLAEGAKAAEAAGVEFITGIEISTKSEHEQHILGYYINPEEPSLLTICTELLRMREERTDRILDFLASNGVTITQEDLAAVTPGVYIGRPHIAQAMMRKGYVNSIEEAFRRYLAGEEFRKVRRPKLSAEEAIFAIRKAGGVAVLAHPHSLKLSGEELVAAIGALKEIGLSGLECFYGNYFPSDVALYKDIAEKLGLIVTGGSDFHGSNVKPGICIGTGFENRLAFTDYSAVEKLREMAK